MYYKETNLDIDYLLNISWYTAQCGLLNSFLKRKYAAYLDGKQYM